MKLAPPTGSSDISETKTALIPGFAALNSTIVALLFGYVVRNSAVVGRGGANFTGVIINTNNAFLGFR